MKYKKIHFSGHAAVQMFKRGNCYIITAYQPDAKLWNEKFTFKK